MASKNREANSSGGESRNNDSIVTSNSASDTPTSPESSTPFSPSDREVRLIPATALYDYLPSGSESNKLSLKAGETVYILKQHHSGWWSGLVFVAANGRPRCGWFPATYVKLQQDGGSSPNTANTFSAQLPVSSERWLPVRMRASSVNPINNNSLLDRKTTAIPADSQAQQPTNQPAAKSSGQEESSGSNNSVNSDLVVNRGNSMPNLTANGENNSISLSTSKLNLRVPDSTPSLAPPPPASNRAYSSSQRLFAAGNVAQSAPSLRPSPSNNSLRQCASNLSIRTTSDVSDNEEEEYTTVKCLNETLKAVKTLAEQEQQEFNQVDTGVRGF